MVLAVSFLIHARYLGSQYQKKFGMIEQIPLIYVLLKVCGFGIIRSFGFFLYLDAGSSFVCEPLSIDCYKLFPLV